MAQITIRRYTVQDIDKIITLIEDFLQEDRGDVSYENHYKSIDFDKQKVYSTLINRHNDPDFFCHVVLCDQEIVGGFCAYIAQPFFTTDRIAYDQLLYITPTFVNVRAVIRLIQKYVEWASQRNVVECRLCSSTGYNQEAFTKLCKYTGFKSFEIGFVRRF